MPLTEMQMIIGIGLGILFMVWCIKGGSKGPRSISADRPKGPRPDPREFEPRTPIPKHLLKGWDKTIAMTDVAKEQMDKK